MSPILEIGRWAMSGANGQPWDFIVVKDPQVKKELFASAPRRTTASSTGWNSSATKAAPSVDSK